MSKLRVIPNPVMSLAWNEGSAMEDGENSTQLRFKLKEG